MKILGKLASFGSAKCGSIAAMSGAMLALATLSTGAAIDYSVITMAKAEIKDATEAAALAAVRSPDSPLEAAESMFDLSLATEGSKFKNIKREYSKQGLEHIMSASANVQTFVLGTVFKDLGVIAAESAAVENIATSGATDQLVPCIHLTGNSNSKTIILEPGSKIVGDNCVLVLDSDDPSRLDISSGTLDIAGFCVLGDSKKNRVNALKSRLRIPYLPDFCEDMNAGLKPDNSPCEVFNFRNGMEVLSRNSAALQGGRYCGDVMISMTRATLESIPDQTTIFDVEEGRIMIAAEKFDIQDTTFVMSKPGDVAAIVLGATQPSVLSPPKEGYYKDISIYQEPGRLDSFVLLYGPIEVQGRIAAPGSELYLNGNLGLEPIHATSIRMAKNTTVEFDNTTTTTNAVIRARLVR